MVSRIKVMASLDIAEKRLPQDGRIALRVAGRPIDVRVSPSHRNGERVGAAAPRQAGRPPHARRAGMGGLARRRG